MSAVDLRVEDGENGDSEAAASASSRHTSVPVTQSEPPALRPSASEPQAAASTSRPRSGRSTVLWVAAGLLVAAMLLVAFTRMTLGTRRAGDSGAHASTEPSAPVSEPSVQAPPILANATSADPAIPATASAQASTAVSARAAPALPKDFAPRKDYGF